jgi:hypothetical protein
MKIREKSLLAFTAGRAKRCPHLVAVIDRTLVEFNGGAIFISIDRLTGILSDYIRVTLSD